jgi:hypothetical protein
MLMAKPVYRALGSKSPSFYRHYRWMMFGFWLGLLSRYLPRRGSLNLCGVLFKNGENPMKIYKKAVRFGSGVALAVASGVSMAAVDTTAAVAEIDGGSIAVQAIGGAALLVLAGASVFKYVRRAL